MFYKVAISLPEFVWCILPKVFLALGVFFFIPTFASAGSIQLEQAYDFDENSQTFTILVTLDTDGEHINAAEAVLSFPPDMISNISLNYEASIFDMWAVKPYVSIKDGVIGFGGGKVGAFIGKGELLQIQFILKKSGKFTLLPEYTRILADDGVGTNTIARVNYISIYIDDTALPNVYDLDGDGTVSIQELSIALA